ncbi:putative TOS1-like glycosyl hydrolase-domain-containing protein [Cladorrhinum sp. PSN332]|nr:putative TOS1-like glycosyl hydrolase-domain-containing protein [Cladorrhinum sp. PSN332]
MVALFTAAVAVLGCAATTAAGRARRDSTAQDSVCDVEDGNRYCAPVSHVRYKVNVNSAGSYREVINMNMNTGQCDFQDKKYSGPLAPFNEPISVHFRGPIRLKQFAVYIPMNEGLGQQKFKVHNRVDGDVAASPVAASPVAASPVEENYIPQKAGNSDNPSSKFAEVREAEKLAKKDVDYVQLDLAKLEQRTQNVVWVTETATFWATVTAHAGGHVKANSDGAGCGAAVQPPISIKSQAPMVPVNGGSRPPFEGQSVVTTSTAVSGTSTSTESGAVAIIPPTISSVSTTTAVAASIFSTSIGPSSEVSSASSAVPAPVISSAEAPTSASIVASTIQSLGPSSAATASISSAVDIPVNQPTPSSQAPEQSSVIVSSVQSPAASPSNNAGIEPASNIHHDFHRVGYYHAETGQAGGLVFLGNKGDGIASGQYSEKFGASLAYIAPNASVTSNVSMVLGNILIPSTEEFSIFSSVPCFDPNATCSYTRPGDNIPAFQGFAGSYRIFMFEFSMPHDPFPKAISQAQYDTPAIWMLNSRIPLTQQYGDCSCWEGGQGCGEFDIFETLSAGEAKAVTSIKAAGDGGNQGLSDWLERPVDEKVGMRLAVGLDEKGGMMWISVLGEGTDGKEMFDGELTGEQVEAMKG